MVGTNSMDSKRNYCMSEFARILPLGIRIKPYQIKAINWRSTKVNPRNFDVNRQI